MLLIVCHAGEHRYAIESRQVKEVLPRVALRPLSQGPSWLAGLLLYRGTAVPVVDLGMRLGAASCLTRLSNRIVVLQIDAADAPRTAGLLAERVEIRDSMHAVSQPTEERSGDNRSGRLLLDAEGVLELVDVPRLLNENWAAPFQLVAEALR